VFELSSVGAIRAGTAQPVKLVESWERLRHWFGPRVALGAYPKAENRITQLVTTL
jgi:hypothetical protein